MTHIAFTIPSRFQRLLHQARGIMGFFNDYQGFKTISRVFSIISWVFNIFSKVVASRFKLVGTGTISRWDLVQSMTSRGATASPCWHQ